MQFLLNLVFERENKLNCQIFGRCVQSGSKVNFLDSEVFFFGINLKGGFKFSHPSLEN